MLHLKMWRKINRELQEGVMFSLYVCVCVCVATLTLFTVIVWLAWQLSFAYSEAPLSPSLTLPLH